MLPLSQSFMAGLSFWALHCSRVFMGKNSEMQSHFDCERSGFSWEFSALPAPTTPALARLIITLYCTKADKRINSFLLVLLLVFQLSYLIIKFGSKYNQHPSKPSKTKIIQTEAEITLSVLSTQETQWQKTEVTQCAVSTVLPHQARDSDHPNSRQRVMLTSTRVIHTF